MISFDRVQGWNQYVIIHGFEGVRFAVFFGQYGRLVLIVGHQPLVIVSGLCHARPVAQPNADAFQLWDILAQDPQAHLHRCRQEYTLGPPEPRPKSYGSQPGALRYSRALSVE